MQWSIRLGAHKPEVLQQIEKRIWKAILNIVNQPGDYLAILNDLAFAFPSVYIQELRTQSETASGWFNIDLQQSETCAIAGSNTVQNFQECNTKDQASSAQQSGIASSPVSFIPKPLENPIIRVAQARTSSPSAFASESQTNEVSNSNEETGGVLDRQKDQAKDLRDNQVIEKSKVNGDGENKDGDDEEMDNDGVEDAGRKGGKGQVNGGGKDKAGNDEEMVNDMVQDAGGGGDDKAGDDEEMVDDRVLDADGGGEDKAGNDEEMVDDSVQDAGGGGEDKAGEEMVDDRVEDAGGKGGKGQVDGGGEDKAGDDEEMDNDGIEDPLRRSNRTRNSQLIPPNSSSPNKVRRKKPLASANQAPSPPKVGMVQLSLFASEKTIGGETLRVLKVCITPCYSFSIYSAHDFQEKPQTATLQDSDAKEVHLGLPMTVYDIEGNPHIFTPRLNVCSLVLVP